MLYKHSEVEKPRKEKIHGMDMDTITIEPPEVEKTLSLGWSMTTTEAKELYDKTVAEDKEPPEFDSNGFKWDERINVQAKTQNSNGVWRIIPGTKKEVLEAVRAEIKPEE